ncbi:deoxyheptonate aldolase [Thermoplasma volcanium GSS1]|uniref:Deoxyheptonate aldolase n=1 Tax=Thermoplasma volcanium (strain ATCC 51530 / DSM 4299 / JCM 9571 / NBRC 15438 / GSS1) TaxID=273116 RepID=Q978P0_THEVO|nr:3-deoxy-7-phosphoheptulonate synthase [Thermoplasma volcanium]BAB60517.1 deoxyheptonate aldolase [Thermoplasma volcanium GSS1]
MIMIADNEEIKENVVRKLEENGSDYKVVPFYEKYVIIEGNKDAGERLYSKKYRDKTVVDVGDIKIGEGLVFAAGPCSVEDEDQIIEIARSVKKAGANMLRGGAFKPRTSPYSFQGLGEEGLELLKKAKEDTGLPIVTEIMNPEYYKFFDDIDMLQVGSRNAQNFDLLRFLGRQKKPVLLKNGMGNTLKEWLEASEYIMSGGNGNVVLCYRGVRGIEEATRFSMNVGTVIAARSMTHLPMCVDPSHASGKREYVEAMTLAAVAAGADMIEIEVHNNPDCALSDSEQQVTPEVFGRIVKKAKQIKNIVSNSQFI